MMTIALVIALVLGFPVVMEFIFSIIGKEYKGYSPPKRYITFWSWVYHSWNHVGPRDFKKKQYDPVRHIGVRWFGHEWEKILEIPMGELRF